MLPAILRQSRPALCGYEVYSNVNGRFRAVNPLQIDWRRVDMSRIQIKQPPGEANALGAIKFMFPNQYAVYLHDTPSKSLFAARLPGAEPRLHARAGPVGLRRRADDPGDGRDHGRS